MAVSVPVHGVGTTYSVKDSQTLYCKSWLMTPGTFLYMPKGVVHYANTTDKAIHITVVRQHIQ